MDIGDDERRPTIADVPGLIEGASSGAGLGHAFLRHVERTRVLIHFVDGSDRDPEWNHGVIRDELAAHDPALLDKPMLVVFNKLDLPAAIDAWPAFRAARAAHHVDVLAARRLYGMVHFGRIRRMGQRRAAHHFRRRVAGKIVRRLLE